MFVQQSQLEYALTKADYCSDEQYRAELEHLFLPAWHFIGTIHDFRKDGDFITRELYGHPVLIHRLDGVLHAYLNVCAHRHCLLTKEPKGWTSRLRCQYHGWEFDKEGRTGKIPDAQCFRPFDRERARLHKFRVETCGELVFVSLVEHGPSLREWLSPIYDFCAESFASPYRLAWQWAGDYAANWKLVVENNLEAYHVPVLHARTFGEHPTEEESHHELNDRYTILTTTEPDNAVRKIKNWWVRRLGCTPQNQYIHRHVHPNFVVISLDVSRMIQVFVPTSPTTMRHMCCLYTLRGHRRGPIARLLARALSGLTTWITRKIVFEDLPVFPSVQKGVEASIYRGIIGTLEERIHVFQQYVIRQCGSQLGQGQSRTPAGVPAE